VATLTSLNSLRDVLDWFCDSHHSCCTCDFWSDKTEKLNSGCPIAELKMNILTKLEKRDDPLNDVKKDIMQLKVDVAKLHQKDALIGEKRIAAITDPYDIETNMKLGRDLYKP